jgi:TetR/AcrR family transcriptional repressor of mexJK operon
MYAHRQLTVVLTPRLMQLRRLVIGEVALAASGLVVDDPLTAASHFNWLVMSEPLNKAMLLGDEAIPKPTALRRHAAEGVRVFLAAYGKK